MIKKNREVGYMALAQIEVTPSITVNKKRTKECFQKLNQNVPSDEYWKTCKDMRENINRSNIQRMNELIHGKE